MTEESGSCDDELADLPVVETAEESLREEFIEELKEQRPDAAERAALKQEHRHHLVRETTSRRTETEQPVEGMEIEKCAEIPDIYCFTCEEWIGVSGVDLRGTPRSKDDAYYLGGPPEAIEKLRTRVHHAVADLAEDIIDNHPYIDGPEAAAEFIADEVEQVSDQLVVTTSSDTSASSQTDSSTTATTEVTNGQ